MNLRSYLILLTAIVFTVTLSVSAQVDSAVGQFTSSPAESFAGSMSGDGRFVVFESKGNLATENPRNADGNSEIFLFDYAQRRIFQITDTKSVLIDPAAPITFSNIRVDIVNTRPVISNDGKWIAFSSNATIAYPGDGTNPPVISTTNPGNFDGNTFTSPTPTPSPSPSPSPGANPLTHDANLEMWLYEIPPYAPVADLSAGDEVPFVNLSPFDAEGTPTAGNFIRATNTIPSQLPRAGTATTGPFVADDNHDASISDDGDVIAFVSSRDLVPAIGNPFPAADNDEIFTFVRSTSTLGQVTKTPRGTAGDPIYNKNVTISGDGSRVAFASNADGPIVDMAPGGNPSTSRNEEIFVADLVGGSPTAATLKKQLTTTTPTTPGALVNILDLGRRMSRDGRYVAFDSYADLANENGGTNQTSFALYLYDLQDPTTPVVRRILARSNADSAASGGDIARYPGFTDTDAAGSPATLVLETRMNIKPDGTVPATEADGLNPIAGRPVQIYKYPLDVAPSAATFTRLTKLPISNTFLASTQPLPSNSFRRIAFNLALTELGTGNFDFFSEVYYLLTPQSVNTSAVNVHYATGATRLPVSLTAVPTPSPTPTPSPSPTGTPLEVTPPAVLGVAPGMITIMGFDAGFDQPIIARTAVGSNQRSFQLPMELSGLTMTVNGVAVGLKSVSRHQIVFVPPPALNSQATGTSYPVVINNNGTIMRTTIVIVPTRPDIFSFQGVAPLGRSKMYNVTNRVRTTEPFTVTTFQLRGGRRVPSRMRLYMTGILNVAGAVITVKIGNVSITPVGNPVSPRGEEPGVNTIDFALPATLNNAGDVPVEVFVNVNGTIFSSRLADTTSHIFIL